MAAFSDFSTIEHSNDVPLVVHRHGGQVGRALIVFIHGLGGDRYGTWTPKGSDPTKTSLARFLYDDIPELDVGLYTYHTLLRRLGWGKSVELNVEATLLADRLRQNAEEYRSVVLAGHSMGGILARAAVHELIDRNDTDTLAAVKALFLLATPQAGSTMVPWFLGPLTPDTRALRPHGSLVTKIHQVFTDRVVSAKEHAKSGQFFIPTFVVAGSEDVWVDRFSAGLNVPTSRIRNVRNSHTGAVKPSTRDDDYIWLRERLKALI